MSQSDRSDPTRIGNQPALRTSSGASWLVVGAIFVIICGGLLVALNSLQHPLGLIGAGAILSLYLAMLVTARVVRPRRVRLVTLACLLIAIAVTGLGFVLVINAAEWTAVV